MKPPCEIVVWYVIPAIRSQLAKSLLELGMTQLKVSQLLDVTQPAVSQYVSSKRGSGIQLDNEIKANIKEFAKELVEGQAKKEDIMYRTCNFCQSIKTKDIVSQLDLELSEKCQKCIE